MSEEKLKLDKRFLYYRAYCVVSILVWNAVGIWMMNHPKQNIQYIFMMVPFLIPALIMLLHWAMFPFKYSILGSNQRMPFPQEPPILERTNWGGSIGWCALRGIPFTLYVFSSGVGGSFFGKSKVFIPKENISLLNGNSFTGYKLTHSSPEVRSPIVFSNKEIYEKLQEVLRIPLKVV